MQPTLYAGPGKVYLGSSYAMQAEGENGQVRVETTEPVNEIAAAMFGKVAEQVLDQNAAVTVRPFDQWLLLPALFPSFLGVTTSAGAGALKIGARTHGSTNTPCQVWTSDGRLYTLVRAAVTGHPTMHLGVDKPLFGDVKIEGIGDTVTPVALGSSGYLFSGNAITESGAADPGAVGAPPAGEMSMSDFIREPWTGTWGAVAGFTGVQAEEEWTLDVAVKYSPLKVQAKIFDYKLDSVEFMFKVRPVGPTQTQILAALGLHTQGGRLGSSTSPINLVLTGANSGKTVTLVNCGIKGVGFEFGGTALGTGEVGFVTQRTFSAGVPQPSLIFSA